MGRERIESSAEQIEFILYQYVHDLRDREIMFQYLANFPGSIERLAEVCDVSVSTVKRAIDRNSFIYKYLK
jgi:predicted transcriptional regulator